MKHTSHSFRAIKAAHRGRRSPVDLGGVVDADSAVQDEARDPGLRLGKPQLRRMTAALLAAAAVVAGVIVFWPDRSSPEPTVAVELPVDQPLDIAPEQKPAESPRRRLQPPRLPSIRQATVSIPARPPIARMPSLAAASNTDFSH